MSSVTLHHYNYESWEAIAAALESARTSIDIEHFIFKQGGVGDALIAILLRKAKAGVRVRLLLDAIGSVELAAGNLAKTCAEAGIALRFFNSIIPLSVSHHTPLFFRDHQKLIVVDGERGMTGGVCIDERMRQWRDTLITLSGPAVEDMRASFEHMWKLARKEHRLRDMPRRPRKDEHYLVDMPFSTRRPAYKELRRAIRNAKRYLYLTTPYFVPPHRLIRLIKGARKRGVDVRILLPTQSDARFVDIAAESYFENLLLVGVRVYRYLPSNLHAKISIIDDAWSMVGSHNLDHLSFQYNFEGSFITTDPQVAIDLRAQFEKDTAHSREITQPLWQKRGWRARLLEVLIWPLSFFM